MKINIDIDKLIPMINDFIDKASDKLVEEAKIQCPVATGKLKDSIEIKNKDYNNKIVKVGTDINYGLFQEMGTYKMSPQPYLRPSLDLLMNNLKG